MAENPSPEKRCPRCSTPIPSDSGDPDPQCPRCLLRPPWEKASPVAITLGPGQSFVPPSIEELSEHIEGYEVEAKIGQGGMGAVYLGRQKSLDRKVAIKILPPQIAERPGFRERFAREGRALAKLNHPNIVAVHDFGQAGPYAMLVMELVEGANLREVMAQGKLSASEALEIIPQLCDALSYAHEEGVVHRDIKPENLLFDHRGRLKITDFGLAKLLVSKSDSDADRTLDAETQLPEPTQSVVGTLHYMAPEQIENPKSVDHRADIYALGVVFYEMLTGELPIGRFDPPSALKDEKQPSTKPQPLSIDVKIDQVVLRALEKHPEKRYASASELRSDIDSIESHPESPDGSRDRVKQVREGVHRVGETAAEFASQAYDRGTRLVRQVRPNWTAEYFDSTAWISIAALIGGVVLSLVCFSDPGGEVPGTFLLTLGICISIFSARLGLHVADKYEPPRETLVHRFILGAVYLVALGFMVVVPFTVALVTWCEIYGYPEDPGDVGWFRDWVNSGACAILFVTCFWFLVCLFHLVFPGVLQFLFKPFVGKFSGRNAFVAACILTAFFAIGSFGLLQFSYRPFDERDTLSPKAWNELSPRDRAMAEREQRKRDSEAALRLEMQKLLEEKRNQNG